jgi:hypothetical protein
MGEPSVPSGRRLSACRTTRCQQRRILDSPRRGQWDVASSLPSPPSCTSPGSPPPRSAGTCRAVGPGPAPVVGAPEDGGRSDGQRLIGTVVPTLVTGLRPWAAQAARGRAPSSGACSSVGVRRILTPASGRGSASPRRLENPCRRACRPAARNCRGSRSGTTTPRRRTGPGRAGVARDTSRRAARRPRCRLRRRTRSPGRPRRDRWRARGRRGAHLDPTWDHSGWPFTDSVTPFTFSPVIVLSILLGGLLLTTRGKAWAGSWLGASMVLGAIVPVVHFASTADQEAPLSSTARGPTSP